MSDNGKIIVIIPTYNERENIEALIPLVLHLPEPIEILIIDDGSPDGTADIVRKMQEQFPERLHLLCRAGKMGLGTAYITGFTWGLEKGYTYLCEMDADFSHAPEDLLQLIQTCKKESWDLAIGSRYINGVTVVNWPIGRVLMSYFASYYVRLVTGMNVQDTTAGFKCYHRRVLETIPYQSVRFVGYAFQIQMKFLTWKYGFKIGEVPVIFRDRVKGVSKMSTNIFTEAIFGVVRMRLESLFKTYHRKPEAN
jgi:dolichol-phosphate mannosyltransferase